MSRNNYARIKNFGCSTVSPNYYSACLDNTVDAGFLMGANPQTWNSRSQECQSLLSQYVAENSNKSNQLDDISIAAINLQGKGFPNPIASCNTNLSDVGGFIKEQSYGSQILGNAAWMKYCKFDNANIFMTNINPNDPSSPVVPVLRGIDKKSICTVDPSKVDNDPLMNAVLQNPQDHITLLQNIRNNTPNLGGTRLGNFYQLNNNYFNNL
jgi:hypothetical protein